MNKNEIYDSIISIVMNPESFLNWKNLKKAYEKKELLKESEVISFFIKEKFEKKENVNNSIVD